MRGEGSVRGEKREERSFLLQNSPRRKRLRGPRRSDVLDNVRCTYSTSASRIRRTRNSEEVDGRNSMCSGRDFYFYSFS